MMVPSEISATTHHRKPRILVTLPPRVFGAPSAASFHSVRNSAIQDDPDGSLGELRLFPPARPLASQKRCSDPPTRRRPMGGCVSSEGWHVQQGKGLPGQESEAP